MKPRVSFEPLPATYTMYYARSSILYAHRRLVRSQPDPPPAEDQVPVPAGEYSRVEIPADYLRQFHAFFSGEGSPPNLE